MATSRKCLLTSGYDYLKAGSYRHYGWWTAPRAERLLSTRQQYSPFLSAWAYDGEALWEKDEQEFKQRLVEHCRMEHEDARKWAGRDLGHGSDDSDVTSDNWWKWP